MRLTATATTTKAIAINIKNMRKSKTRGRGRKKKMKKMKNIAWWAWHECAWQHCWWADNCKQHCCPIVALIVVEVTTLAPPPASLGALYLCPWPTFIIVVRQFFSRTRCLCWTAPCAVCVLEQAALALALSNTANCAFQSAIKVNEFFLRCPQQQLRSIVN